MELNGLHQPCNNSTLLGAMTGAATYYGLGVSPPMLYGLSGHAFLINIHRQLCPSGPYCWDRAPFFGLLRNAGLAVEDLGFWWSEGGPCPREELEATLRAALDAGIVGFLVNMEYQLITGYDETGFLTAQPWAPHCDFPQKHVTFGTWAEMGSEVHVNFHTVKPVDPIDRVAAVRAAVTWAQQVWSAPDTAGDYGLGPHGYDYWLLAVRDGHGASHGNWWNGTVYAECRDQAALFVAELAALDPDWTEPAAALSADYAKLAGLLKRAADKEVPADDKVAVLEEAAVLDKACLAKLGTMVGV